MPLLIDGPSEPGQIFQPPGKGRFRIRLNLEPLKQFGGEVSAKIRGDSNTLHEPARKARRGGSHFSAGGKKVKRALGTIRRATGAADAGGLRRRTDSVLGSAGVVSRATNVLSGDTGEPDLDRSFPSGADAAQRMRENWTGVVEDARRNAPQD